MGGGTVSLMGIMLHYHWLTYSLEQALRRLYKKQQKKLLWLYDVFIWHK